MFAYRLCLALGKWSHPDKMLKEMTAPEFAGWMAYHNENPFGEDYTRYLIAQNTAELSNRWRGESEEPDEAIDFIPWKEKPPQTEQEIMSNLRSFLGR